MRLLGEEKGKLTLVIGGGCCVYVIERMIILACGDVWGRGGLAVE